MLNKQHMKKHKFNKFPRNTNFGFTLRVGGFTLSELMVVVSIIAILIAAAAIGGLNVLRRAQATRIASDFKKIETAWNTWRVDSNFYYPREAEYATMINSGCGGANNVYISNTHLFSNTRTINGEFKNWNGPYLDKPVYDPIRNEYAYDRDGSLDVADPDPACSTLGHGTNIILEWCPANDGYYNQLLPYLDRLIDDEDGRCNGKFRWINTSPRRMLYNIDTCKGTYAPCG